MEKGKALLENLSPGAFSQLEQKLKPLSPSLFTQVVEHAYGDVLQPGALATTSKQLILIAILAAQGGASVQLDKHLKAALSSGIQREQLLELADLVALYSGIQNGLSLTRKISEIELT